VKDSVPDRVRRALLAAILVAAVFGIQGCGGGSSGGGQATPPPPVATAPKITTQPANQTVAVGKSATFSVVATGAAPLSYQWQKNGTNISGATAASYTTPATGSADNGATFRVSVSNSAGSATSALAILAVTSSGGSAVSVKVSPEKSCAYPGVPFNGTCLFYATVTNDPKVLGVMWSLEDAAGCPLGTCGTTLPIGRVPETANTFSMLYFGPDISNYPSSVILKATSIADPTKSDSTTISLTATPPSIGIVSPLISANAAGTTGGSGDSIQPVVNMDGGYVAFASLAQDISSLAIAQQQVFLKATCIGQPAGCVPLGTIVVSVDGSGHEGNGGSVSPSISSDGLAIGFTSEATNLDPSAASLYNALGPLDYVATACGAGHCVPPPPHLVSVGPLGDGRVFGVQTLVAGNADSISPDGRFMVFAGACCAGPNLSGMQYGQGIYLADDACKPAPCGIISYVSTDDSGNPAANPDPLGPPFTQNPVASVLTSGGGSVAFVSSATNLVPGVPSGQPQVYLRNLGLNRTFLISQDSTGKPAPAALDPSISSDGRFVSFVSTGLTPGDTSGNYHLYVRDTCLNASGCTPATTLADVATVGAGAGKPSASGLYVYLDAGQHAISADGRYVVFISTSPDLAPTAVPGLPQVYVRDMSCATTAMCPNAGIHPVAVSSGGTAVGTGTFSQGTDWASISADGHYVVFALPGADHSQVVLAKTGF
jgi:hypothetical protein